MPGPFGTTFGDLVGKLTVLRVECTKCGRFGRYPLRRLIDRRGRDARIIDWLAELTAGCPRRRAASVSDRCHARCPDLPKVDFDVCVRPFTLHP
jgi:hypothetical protein